MPEDLFLGAAVADAGDHRGVVERVRQHDRAGDLAGQGRQRRLVGDVTRGEDERRLAPVQVGELLFEQEMHVRVAGDVAGAAGAGAERLDRLNHRAEHRRVLAHPEVVVGAPHRDLGADAVIEGARKPAATPLEIGKDPVSSLGAERIEALSEKAFVVHVAAAAGEP